MSDNFLIYGSYGYTGDLLARAAVARGCGRSWPAATRSGWRSRRTELGLQHIAFSLDDRPAMDLALGQVAVVLHCAGPFSRTAQPMADGCLRNGVHYLDITGEIAVFEALARRGAEAQAAGVMLLPGAGFDVVPSDCLAAHLKRRLPTADRLALGIRGLGSGLSAAPPPPAWRASAWPPGCGARASCCPCPPAPSPARSTTAAAWRPAWPSAGATCPRPSTAPASPTSRSTSPSRVPCAGGCTARVSSARCSAHGRCSERSRPRSSASRPAQRPNSRARGRSLLWGEVLDPAGQRRVSRLTTPDGYTLTVLSALAIVEKVLAGQVKPGFQTPSLAYGPDLVLELPGVEREDVAS